MAVRNQPQQFVDPVCGMAVKPATAPARPGYDGVEIYFCAESCKERFDAKPLKYTGIKRQQGFWRHYLDRLNKATGGKPPACH